MSVRKVLTPILISALVASGTAHTRESTPTPSNIGLQIGLVSHNEIMLFNKGQTGGPSSSRVSRDSLFEAASLSKLLLAYVALELVSEGTFDLDSPLQNYTYLERLKSDAPITARMVLTHRSGLPNWSADPTSQEWASSPLEPAFEPGSCWNYSGEAFYLLQRAMEAVTGQGYGEMISQRIFSKAGMTHSSLTWREDMLPLATSGYDGVSFKPLRRFELANGAFSLVTNAEDLAKFARLAMINAKERPILAELFTSTGNHVSRCRNPLSVDSRVFTTLGMEAEQTSFGQLAWHWGNNGNFKSFLAVDLAGERALVLLTNSSSGDQLIDQQLRAFFGPETYAAQTFVVAP